MRYESIADIYSANEKFRGDMLATLEEISADEAKQLPDGEKWTIQEIAEHVSMVEFGVSRICSRLIGAAKVDGKAADGSFSLSPTFGEKAAVIATAKVEAPERVHPTGEVEIDEVIQRLAASTEAIAAVKMELESLDVSAHTFPHPFFGELTAPEWLVVAGLHERRHNQQIKRILTGIRQ